MVASVGCEPGKGRDISLAALQRHDPYINSIVDMASQVALYTFGHRANEWEKTDVEGTLFVYTRSASPKHGFTIMNRLSMENRTEPITKDLDFQLQDPFLLYRNARPWRKLEFKMLAAPGIGTTDQTSDIRPPDSERHTNQVWEGPQHQPAQDDSEAPRRSNYDLGFSVILLFPVVKAKHAVDGSEDEEELSPAKRSEGNFGHSHVWLRRPQCRGRGRHGGGAAPASESPGAAWALPPPPSAPTPRRNTTSAPRRPCPAPLRPTRAARPHAIAAPAGTWPRSVAGLGETRRRQHGSGPGARPPPAASAAGGPAQQVVARRARGPRPKAARGRDPRTAARPCARRAPPARPRRRQGSVRLRSARLGSARRGRTPLFSSPLRFAPLGAARSSPAACRLRRPAAPAPRRAGGPRPPRACSGPPARRRCRSPAPGLPYLGPAGGPETPDRARQLAGRGHRGVPSRPGRRQPPPPGPSGPGCPASAAAGPCAARPRAEREGSVHPNKSEVFVLVTLWPRASKAN
uniref:mRNA-decapping enzyme 1B-like n=1 Tax=Jaculus jaculus TaxID=51337 RepID=UPI001E1B1681|nr:mRNA-decapping enzyme 1B-like [Jaculus jaculus]